MLRGDHSGPARVQIGQHRQVVRARFAREGGPIVIDVYANQAQTELSEQRALIIQLAFHTEPSALWRRWPSNLDADPRVTVVVCPPDNPYGTVDAPGRATGSIDGADERHQKQR